MSGKDPKLGFIGFGELASGIAMGLIQSGGLKEVRAYDKVLGTGSEAEKGIRERAAKGGVILLDRPQELVSQAEVLLCAVVPSQAVSVAQSFSSCLQPHHIYADLNSCSPQLKIAAEEEILPSGASYVDVGVVGGVAVQGYKIPCLLCGAAAEKLCSLLAPLGMNVRVVQGPTGTAARIKMLRSVTLKGIEALLLEMLVAAKDYGLEEEMMNSVAETFDRGNFKQYSNMLLTTHAIHAGRRLAEVEMVAETVRGAGIHPFMSEGMVNFFAHSTRLELGKYFNQIVPGDYKEVTSAIRKLSRS